MSDVCTCARLCLSVCVCGRAAAAAGVEEAVGAEGPAESGSTEWETDTDDEPEEVQPARRMVKPVFVPKARPTGCAA